MSPAEEEYFLRVVVVGMKVRIPLTRPHISRPQDIETSNDAHIGRCLCRHSPSSRGSVRALNGAPKTLVNSGRLPAGDHRRRDYPQVLLRVGYTAKWIAGPWRA